jgi:peptide/nickel transport system ATP-binding protein
LNSEPLLNVKDLTVSFEADQEDLEITDKVSFQIYPGEIFGLVGESGCGKTVTALALLKLLPIPGGKVGSGRILFKGRDILALAPEEIRDLRGKDISMIFQEPAGALNPLLTVKRQLMECFDYHAFPGDKERRVKELLQRVGFPDPQRILAAFPHELSGGMLQRVMIAMALIMRPALVIADEPTTALDVTVQAQIMELLMEMKTEMEASILLISHNLGLMAQYATRLAVMYAGRIVEESDIQTFLDEPLHPYTKGLLEALPTLHEEQSALVPIPGQVPQPKEYEAGCRFRGRCCHAFQPCVHKPDLFTHGAQRAGHRVACFLYSDREAR